MSERDWAVNIGTIARVPSALHCDYLGFIRGIHSVHSLSTVDTNNPA